jgi:hypothetical protein
MQFGNAQAIIRAGEPMELQIRKDFLPAIAPNSPLSGRAMGVLQMA